MTKPGLGVTKGGMDEANIYFVYVMEAVDTVEGLGGLVEVYKDLVKLYQALSIGKGLRWIWKIIPLE